MLFSEGFEGAKVLAKKMTVLYKLSREQLSKQFHYDFGLRALKSVLVMAGGLKRQYENMSEDLVLMRCLRDSNMPKFGEKEIVKEIVKVGCFLFRVFYFFYSILSLLFPLLSLFDCFSLSLSLSLSLISVSLRLSLSLSLSLSISILFYLSYFLPFTLLFCLSRFFFLSLYFSLPLLYMILLDSI